MGIDRGKTHFSYTLSDSGSALAFGDGALTSSGAKVFNIVAIRTLSFFRKLK